MGIFDNKLKYMENKTNKDKFPGYPSYPATDDITRKANNNGKESLDADPIIPQPYNDTIDNQDLETAILPGTDADITDEDLFILEATGQNMNSQDSVNLIHSNLDNLDDDGDPLNEGGSTNNDLSGNSLDVPGSQDDDEQENIGGEDEENNYYSLGGDNHDSQEESKGD